MKITNLFLWICISTVCITNVSATNNITSTEPDSITFSIDPNGYEGFCRLDGVDIKWPEDGNFSFTFQPNADLVCVLETGASYADPSINKQSHIYINFKGNGEIIRVIPDSSATISDDKKSIKLNTQLVTIKPKRYDHFWTPIFANYENGQWENYSGNQKFMLINGLTYTIVGGQDVNINVCDNAGNKITNYTAAFSFGLTGEGNTEVWGRNKISAKVSKHKLKFKTYKMLIDPEEISDGNEVYFKHGLEKDTIVKPTTYHAIRGTVNYVTWTDKKMGEKIYYFLQL